jgi:hypothetical protein
MEFLFHMDQKKKKKKRKECCRQLRKFGREHAGSRLSLRCNTVCCRFCFLFFFFFFFFFFSFFFFLFFFFFLTILRKVDLAESARRLREQHR